MKFVTIALLALLALATQSATAFTRFTQYGSVPPPQTFEGVLKSLDTPAQWYDNYVDHFNPQDTRKFKQRFFENTEFADNSNPNAPIFVYIGSEGQLSANWVNSGLMYNNAKVHGASLVALEHRYYGESQPMPNHSFENLRYLTSEQALEDLATFIRWYANNKVTWSRARPIIVFGGSYGATLAAHMRARHPHIVRGAIASSAPFEPEVNFPEYYDVATDALTFFGGDECRTRFGLAATVIKSKLSTPEGRAEVGAKLNVCTPLTPGNMDNINTQAFWTSITDTWAGLVQYNKENTPGRMSIGSFCKTLSDPSTNFWDAYFDGFHKLRTPDTCFKWTYNDMLADLADTTIVPKNNMRQWIYQTCTEWGFYQTLESPKQVYGPKDAVKLELFVKLCQDGYSPKLNKAYILDAADRTRDAYGGWYFQATNVALANGNIDPWHSISIFEKCGKRHPSITIHNAEGTSHCAILYPEQSYDPATLVESRKEIADVITTYVNSKF